MDYLAIGKPTAAERRSVRRRFREAPGYLTTGKRSALTQEYQALVNGWATTMKIPAPRVEVRRRNGGRYLYNRRLIRVKPDCSINLLIHEFAHHVAYVDTGKRHKHGPLFRIALVQVAAVALGLASRYSWATDYKSLRSWAIRHGLAPAPQG
jgi:hypothetical protein